MCERDRDRQRQTDRDRDRDMRDAETVRQAQREM